MDGEQKVFAIGANEIAEGAKKLAEPIEKQPFNSQTQDKFNNALVDPNTRTQIQATEQIGTRPNPLSVAKDIYTQKPEGYRPLDNIEHNVNQANERISAIKETLESPDVNIKSSYQSLLENKLTHIDDNLKVALEKVGIEYEAPQTPVTTGNGVQDAIQKFLGFLSNSQSRLQNVADEVGKYRDQANAKGVSPADMLAVQIKVSYVQQELELFANLLNKALESTKTVMNVQI
jgi:hypothetical protein